MTDRDRRQQVRAQFRGETEAAAVWDALDLLIETDRFLNLGYAPRYLPYPALSTQRRLAAEVGRRLTLRLGYSAGVELLDVGCGRGGPSVVFARRFGFDVTGVDLVADNVRRARATAREADAGIAVLVGDATRLPIATDSVRACVVLDATPYVGDKRALLEEIARVLEPGGVMALTDLVHETTADPATIERFTDAWDMAPLVPLSRYRELVPSVGFSRVRYDDLTAHSVGRFGFWAALFLALVRTPAGTIAGRLLARAGVDLDAVREQVEATRPALPALRHYLITGHRER
ncbi:methyltransferase domain-containing protein [Halapricum hydrolyticum]|uniref:Methyltransferase domain-containing protein n=1 Tax=Halapricum hydrolyticum TaxID=2979991 RepID=A0AAE3IDZ2_9EURY|nr:methyltransferase domain-containing protein [Halapricum hydrolyticum]MCU4719545.1 methyltransferase domain-containing protein [Halapricum hydrolyticum]MCU4728512.1 methyltransferase domain-containing protein [Halapricum hydrolyticum]